MRSVPLDIHPYTSPSSTLPRSLFSLQPLHPARHRFSRVYMYPPFSAADHESSLLKGKPLIRDSCPTVIIIGRRPASAHGFVERGAVSQVLDGPMN